MTVKTNFIHNSLPIPGMREQLPDNSIDCIITSPPYMNEDMEDESVFRYKTWKEYYAWAEEWLAECLRVLKPDGRLCMSHYLSAGNSRERQAPLMRLNSIAEDIGFHHKAVAIWWDKRIRNRTAWGSWQSARSPHINTPYQGVTILYKDHWKKDSEGVSTIQKDEFVADTLGIWIIKPESVLQYSKEYFPLEVPERCIKLFTYEDDIVLDIFMGIGSTGLACVKTNRKFIGFEASKESWDIANRRIEAEMQKTSLFDN
jgi:site-specific DNA-methyltransferase (adenine-specific)